MQITDAAYLLKVLGDNSRLTIVQEIQKKGELCACELLQLVNCKQATLSHHMSILVESGLITARKDGNWVRYNRNIELINELIEFISQE